jgi:hypothetical protein
MLLFFYAINRNLHHYGHKSTFSDFLPKVFWKIKKWTKKMSNFQFSEKKMEKTGKT